MWGEWINGDGADTDARTGGLVEGAGICISGAVNDRVEKKRQLVWAYFIGPEVRDIDVLVRGDRLLMAPVNASRSRTKQSAGPRQWRCSVVAVLVVLLNGVGTVTGWGCFLPASPPRVEVASLERLAFPQADELCAAHIHGIGPTSLGTYQYLTKGTGRVSSHEISSCENDFQFRAIDNHSKSKLVRHEFANEKHSEAINRHEDAPRERRIEYISSLVLKSFRARGGEISSNRISSEITSLFGAQPRLAKLVVSDLGIALSAGERLSGKSCEAIHTIPDTQGSGIPRIDDQKSSIQIKIVDKPIIYDEKRKKLTLEYIRNHYCIETNSVEIKPRMIVIHWTASDTLEGSYQAMKDPIMPRYRKRLYQAGLLNVSAHYLVDRDGTIYRLMPDNYFARHVIGLNMDAIGIENVGGNPNTPLTPKQLYSNAKLIRHLTEKYDIEWLIGHFEYGRFKKTPLWRELDPKYFSRKIDPGQDFMRKLRELVKDLGLKSEP